MKISLLVTGSLLYFSLAHGEEPVVVTKDNIGTFYREYQRLTEEPRYVAPLTILLCAAPSKKVLEKEDAITGPHARISVHYYANAIAAKAINDGSAAFPIGAVIVKEKLAANNTVSDIAGMIKRAAGNDATNGEWEFFFRAPNSDFQSGKLANCVECHQRAPQDQVFAAWKFRAASTPSKTGSSK